MCKPVAGVKLHDMRYEERHHQEAVYQGASRLPEEPEHGEPLYVAHPEALAFT